MNDRLTSYDITNPVINPRILHLYLHHDPLGIGEYQHHNFDLEVFDTIDETSQFHLVVNDKIIKRGSKYADYYGPGTSVIDALESARRSMADFGDVANSNVNFRVVTTIKHQLVFQSKDEPFYKGAVRVYTVPGGWWIQGTTQYDEQPEREVKDFVVWENGVWTDAAQEVETILMTYQEADAVTDQRNNKWLHPMTRFTQST